MNLAKQRKLINETARLGLEYCVFKSVDDGELNIIDEFEASVDNEEATARVEELELQEIDAGEDVELNEMSVVEEW